MCPLWHKELGERQVQNCLLLSSVTRNQQCFWTDNCTRKGCNILFSVLSITVEIVNTAKSKAFVPTTDTDRVLQAFKL